MDNDFKSLLESIIKSQTPYKNIKLVNNLLIVTLNNGQVLTKTNATEDDYNRIVNNNSISEIREELFLKEKEENELPLLPTEFSIKDVINKRIKNL